MDEKQLVDGATALAEKQSRVIKIEPAEQPQNIGMVQGVQRAGLYQLFRR